MKTLLHKLRRDQRGITIIEFAYIAPVFSVLMLGAFDMGHTTYATNVLQGEVQKAGRDATLEGGGTNATTINNKVKAQASQVVGSGATWSFERKFYPSFTKAGAMENFTDAPPYNGVYDQATECFQDENSNGFRDVGGRTGQGGADDIVVYTVTATYPRMFPMYGLLGWPQNQTVRASTVLRNQPFGNQTTLAPVTICPTP